MKITEVTTLIIYLEMGVVCHTLILTNYGSTYCTVLKCFEKWFHFSIERQSYERISYVRSSSAGPHGSRNVKFDQSGCEFIRNNQSGYELDREFNRDVAAEPEL